MVFCRICGIKDMAANRLAAAMQALADVCAEARKDAALEVLCVHSSVYGRFLCVPHAAQALNTAVRVLDEAEAAGVRLAVGVSVGRLETWQDLGLTNLAGPAINLAARLAAMTAAESKIVVTERVCRAAAHTFAFRKERFFGPRSGKIKRTSFSYCVLLHSPPEFGSLGAIGDYRTFDAHAVVYDIAHFSEKSPKEQWEVVTGLREQVVRVLDPIAKGRAKPGQLWYAPAGDGGVVVFATDNHGGDVAWVFARGVAERCRDNNIEIRIGVATGSVVVIGGDLPVGTGVLRADQLSGHPANWQLCVNDDFWEGRPEEVTCEWSAEPVPEDTDALLLERSASDASGEPKASPDVQAPSLADTPPPADGADHTARLAEDDAVPGPAQTEPMASAADASQSEQEETRASTYDGAELAALRREVAGEIETIVGEQVKEFLWAGSRLPGRPTDAKGIAQGLADEPAVTASLGKLVATLKQTEKSRRNPVAEACARIMHQLLRLVAHPGYLTELSERYEEGDPALEVHTDRQCLLAIIVTGMFGLKAKLVEDSDDPRSERQVKAGGTLPEWGGDRNQAVLDVKRYLWNCLFPTQEYDEGRLLSELAARAEQYDHWFLALARDESIPWAEIAGACPGLLLLRVGIPDGHGGILINQQTLGKHLRELLVLFREEGVHDA